MQRNITIAIYVTKETLARTRNHTRTCTLTQVCDLVPAMAGLPVPPPQSLLCTLLWRMRKDRPNVLSHASPRRLANLALSFRSLGHKPDFGFLHLYAQAVRLHWSNFEPWVSGWRDWVSCGITWEWSAVVQAQV